LAVGVGLFRLDRRAKSSPVFGTNGRSRRAVFFFPDGAEALLSRKNEPLSKSVSFGIRLAFAPIFFQSVRKCRAKPVAFQTSADF
jgi:hypothetical protein